MAPSINPNQPRKFISYTRVSTTEQGSSGLGLAAQWASIQKFGIDHKWFCVGRFEEVASGADNNRPQLMQAIQAAKFLGAVLVVSKVDRVSRRLSYVASLIDSAEVELIAVDLGVSCSSFELNLMALIAERERQMISIRTREALAVLKARGVKLGTPNPEKFAAAGRASIQTKTDAFHLSVRPAFEEIMNIGCVYTLSGIADCLNSRGIKTRRGGVWFASSVSNAFKRFEALGQPLAR